MYERMLAKYNGFPGPCENPQPTPASLKPSIAMIQSGRSNSRPHSCIPTNSWNAIQLGIARLTTEYLYVFCESLRWCSILAATVLSVAVAPTPHAADPPVNNTSFSFGSFLYTDVKENSRRS